MPVFQAIELAQIKGTLEQCELEARKASCLGRLRPGHAR